MLTVKFMFSDGSLKEHEALVGETVLDLIRRKDLEYVKGSCEGSLACSTCHVIVHKDWYDMISKHNPISEQESDMLDLAFDLAQTSRLGCQIKLTKEMSGITFIVPEQIA